MRVEDILFAKSGNMKANNSVYLRGYKPRRAALGAGGRGFKSPRPDRGSEILEPLIFSG